MRQRNRHRITKSASSALSARATSVHDFPALADIQPALLGLQDAAALKVVGSINDTTPYSNSFSESVIPLSIRWGQRYKFYTILPNIILCGMVNCMVSSWSDTEKAKCAGIYHDTAQSRKQ